MKAPSGKRGPSFSIIFTIIIALGTPALSAWGSNPGGQERNGSLGRKDDTQEWGFGPRSGIVEVLIEVYIDLLEPP